MWRALICAGVCMLGAASAQAQTLRPAADYGRLPAVGDVDISPDGRHIIIQQSDAAATAFRIINLDTQQSVFSSRIDNPTTLRGVGWADDDHAIFYVSTTANTGSMGVYARGRTRLEYYRAGVYSLSSRRSSFMLEDIPDANLHTGLTALTAPIDGDPGFGRMFAAEREGDELRLQIYRVNLNNGRSTIASRGDGSKADDYLLNPRGEIIARTDSDNDTNEWRLFSYVDGRPHELRHGTEETGSSPGLHGVLADGRLVVSLIDENNAYYLAAIDPRTGEEQLLNPEHPDSNCVIVDRWTGVAVGVCWSQTFTRYRYFQPDLAEVYSAISEYFADGVGRIVSWSRDRSRFVVYGETSRDGGGYYIYEPARNNIIQVGLRYPELTGANFGQRREIRYAARDGTQIPAYLSLPQAGARNMPLVLLVHGGPHLRDDFEFDWWASFLVSRGYAVLQPNFRGSTGYGRDWFVAGRGNWGDGVMQTDVIDGVDALVRQGIVDPSRVCIMGGSYGGYAALAGATLTPDKFACAVSVAGVSDLLQMLDENAESPRSGVAEWWRLSIGDARSDRAHLAAISPARQAARVTAPILLIHGVEDTTVPVSQSRRMRDQLQAAGKQVRYVEMAGDDHSFSNQQTRTQMLQEMETFLAEHLRAH